MAAERRAEATSIRALGFAFHRQHFAGTCLDDLYWPMEIFRIAPRRRKAVSAVLLTGVSGSQRIPSISSRISSLCCLRSSFFSRRSTPLRCFYDAVPIDEGHKAAIFDRLTQTMIAVVRGTLLTALVRVSAGITYWALNVLFPVFLGSISALFSLLPFGGTALVWVPVATYLFWTAPLWKGSS